MKGRASRVSCIALLCLFVAGCGSKPSAGRSAGGDDVRQRFFQERVEEGKEIANQHLQTLSQYPQAERQKVFREAMLPWYYNQLSMLEEYPPEADGHLIASGRIKGYKSVMGKKYRLPK